MNPHISSKTSRFSTVIAFIACGACILAANLFLADKGFPVTEGWYEAYAYAIQSSPDTECSYPRLFIYATSAFQRVFGDSVLVARTAGAIVHSCMCLLLMTGAYITFRTAGAAIAAFTAVALSMTAVFFLAKDYHTAVNLAVAILLIFTVLFVDRHKAGHERSARAYFLCAAFTAMLLVFVKQNTGVFLGIGTLCLLILHLRRGSLPYALLMFAGIGLAVAGYALLAWANGDAPLKTLWIFTGANDAKGSAMSVLTRFVTHPRLLRTLCLGILGAAILATLCFCALRRTRGLSPLPLRILFGHATMPHLRLRTLLTRVSIILSLAICASGFRPGILLTSSLAICLVCTAGAMRRAWCQRRPRTVDVLAISAVMAWYCNTHSSPWLEYMGQLLVITFGLAWLFSRALATTRPVLSGLILASLCLSLAIKANSKRELVFDWWGGLTPRSSLLTSQSSIPQLAGLHMSTSGARMVDDIYAIIMQNKDSHSAIFTFPHMPAFYPLTRTPPMTRGVVHWFDTTPSWLAIDDLSRVRAGLPAVIISMQMPQTAWVAHAEMREQSIQPQDLYYRQFRAWTMHGTYSFVRSWITSPLLDRNDAPSRRATMAIYAEIWNQTLAQLEPGKCIESIRAGISQAKNLSIEPIQQYQGPMGPSMGLCVRISGPAIDVMRTLEPIGVLSERHRIQNDAAYVAFTLFNTYALQRAAPGTEERLQNR